jgi:hypothetical protein
MAAGHARDDSILPYFVDAGVTNSVCAILHDISDQHQFSK